MIVPLAKIADIQTGPFGSQLHEKDYVEGEGTPIVTVEHLGERRFASNNLPLVGNIDYQRLAKYTMRPGDIIFSRVGSVERCSLALPENDGWLFSGRCLRVRPKKGVDSNYLYAYLSAPAIKKYIRSIAVGATMPSINTSIMGEIPIRVPTYEKQRSIGFLAVLFDKKIEVNQRINGYLGELCETIATHQTDTSAKLRDLCFQVNDKVPCTEAVIGSYVSTESLLVNKGGRQVASSLPAMGKVTEYKVGDTLVSNIRPYFKKIWFADQEGTCSGDVIVFRALEAQNAPYVYSILRTSSFFDWVMLGSKGTKMPRGDKKQMMNYPVSLSCKETDLELLSSATKWISSNERQNGRLSELRDVLLPKLMSGEIDVSKVEVPTQPNSHLCER